MNGYNFQSLMAILQIMEFLPHGETTPAMQMYKAEIEERIFQRSQKQKFCTHSQGTFPMVDNFKNKMPHCLLCGGIVLNAG